MNKEAVLKNMNDLVSVRTKLGRSLKRALKSGDKKEAEKLEKLIKQSNKTLAYFGKRFFEVN